MLKCHQLTTVCDMRIYKHAHIQADIQTSRFDANGISRMLCLIHVYSSVHQVPAFLHIFLLSQSVHFICAHDTFFARLRPDNHNKILYCVSRFFYACRYIVGVSMFRLCECDCVQATVYMATAATTVAATKNVKGQRFIVFVSRKNRAQFSVPAARLRNGAKTCREHRLT